MPSAHDDQPAVRPAAALAVAAVTTVALVGGCAPGPVWSSTSDPSGVSTSANAAASSRSTDPETAAALEVLLDERDRATLDGDRPRYAATVADPGSPAGQAQLRAFDTAVALRVTGLRHDPGFTGLPGPASASAPGALAAVLRYRVDGTDTGDRTAQATYHLARDAGQWRIAAEEPSGAGSTAPWLALPGATVERTEHAVVLGTVTRDRLAEYADSVGRARADLDRHWSMPGSVLVLAPATGAEADVLLGRAPGGAPVAATTEGPVGPRGTATGDRVVLDPGAFARLTQAGRQVVIAHELTHVAVRATVAGAQEPWVSEGYADHVGYGYTDLPDDHLAAPLVAAVRAGRSPTRLPGSVEVDPARGDIEVAYLASWQAMELLADRYGEDALRRFVVAATSTGPDGEVRAATDRALREVLGTTRADLTRDWQARLRSLAR